MDGDVGDERRPPVRDHRLELVVGPRELLDRSHDRNDARALLDGEGN